MTAAKTRSLYEGALKGRVVGAFVRLGRDFTVIRPGFDAQGRKRTTWTQVVVDDVPIWEWKITAPLDFVLAKFDSEMKRTIGRDKALFERALQMAQNRRRKVFRDGVAGEAPAPSVALDGRQGGRLYAG